MLRNILLGRDITKRQQLIFELIHNQSLAFSTKSVFSYLRVSNLVFIEANRTGNPRYQAYGYAKHAMNLAFLNQLKPSLRLLKTARVLAEQTTEKELSAYCEGLAGIGYYMAGHLESAKKYLGAGFNAYARLGESSYRIFTVHALRHYYEQTGETEFELELANEELRMAKITRNPEQTAWGLYGLASAQAKSGRLEEADSNSIDACQLIESASTIYSTAIAEHTRAFVLLQMSRYQEAWEVLEKNIVWIRKTFSYCDFVSRTYPLAMEAALGADWCHASGVLLSSEKKRILKRLSRKCFWAARIFKNIPCHCLRVRGRYAATLGKRKRAVKLLTAAIQRAERHGAMFEHARSLLDRSLINPATAVEDRKLGFQILDKLGCVIPAAEMKHFETSADEVPQTTEA